MLYQALSEYFKSSTNISIRGICGILGISRSGYSDWSNRKKSKQKQHKEEIQANIKEIYDKSKKIYGAPKITHILNQKGFQVSQKTVSNYMQEMGIKAWYRKHYTRTTFSVDFSDRLKNLLHRHFNPERPDAVWCTDITYIWTYQDGFVYLTSIMDLYSRKIIAWVLTRDMTAESVLEVIKIAKKRRKVDNPLIIHSDRRRQFTSSLYKELTEKMSKSYSEKGTPWDNACMESFHSLIKREWLNKHKIWDYDQAKRLIFEYIETFYNTVRIHGHCEYTSPNQYEQAYYEKKSIQCTGN